MREDKQRGTGRQAERSTSCTCIIQADSDATLSKGLGGFSSDRNARARNKNTEGRGSVHRDVLQQDWGEEKARVSDEGETRTPTTTTTTTTTTMSPLMLKEEMLFLWDAK